MGYASSGFCEWFTTPKFKEEIDMSNIDKTKLEAAMKENAWLISEKMITEEDEYDIFLKYYENILTFCQ